MPTSSSSRNCNIFGVASPTRATSSTRGGFDLALVLQVHHLPLIFRLFLWIHTVQPPFPLFRLLRCPCASCPSFLFTPLLSPLSVYPHPGPCTSECTNQTLGHSGTLAKPTAVSDVKAHNTNKRRCNTTIQHTHKGKRWQQWPVLA